MSSIADPTRGGHLDDAPTQAARSDWRSRFSQQQATTAAVWILVPLALTFFSWQPLALEAAPGLDPSWEVGLQMALYDGVSFGNHLIFTYGPLGFLSVPTLWYSHAGAAAALYAGLVRLAFVTALFAGARRTYGSFVAIFIALVVASASFGALEAIPFFIFTIWVVDQVSDQRRLRILMALGGTVAGLELLNKTSTGVEIGVLAVVMGLTARGRRRDHLIGTLGALVLAMLVGWIATGQDLGALPAYLRGTEQIIGGFPAAMGIEQPGLGWEYAAGWVAFAFGLVAAWHMTADGEARRRWGIIALWVLFSFFEFKDGFVRHDGHGIIYFTAVMGGFLALRWRSGHRTIALCMTAALFALTLSAEEASFSAVLNPGGDANTAFTEIGQVLIKSKRQAIIAAGRNLIEGTYPIDPQTMRLLRGHTVHVAPDETVVAWAYNLDWRPLPIFQSYSTYTTALDQDNANAINSSHAPQRILRNLDPALDGRVLSFDQPLTTRTILCRYRQLRVTAIWQVLGLGPNRCGAQVLMNTVHANWNQSVSVPAPPNDHSVVFVRIYGVQVSGFERVISLLYKPAERFVVLNSGAYRLVEATAGDGLLLRAPADVDYTPPFNLAPNSTTIGVEKLGTVPLPGADPITYSFYSQSISPETTLAASRAGH